MRRAAGRRRPRTALHGIALAIAAAASVAATVPAIESLSRLRDGNSRFVGDPSASLATPVPDHRSAAAQPQRPIASVLTCADVRVPPEIVFRTAPGELYVVRAAAHIADRGVLASLEYAADRLHAPLLVVMGHDMCDAIRSAADDAAATPGGSSLEFLRKALRPSIDRAAGAPAETRLRTIILAHVEETINQLLDSSAVLRRRAESQQRVIAGAYYETSSGRVHFSEPVRVPPSLTTRATPRPAPPSRAPAQSTASAARPAAAP
jgi:carbonic anhydrase